jgi:hypothetical protein
MNVHWPALRTALLIDVGEAVVGRMGDITVSEVEVAVVDDKEVQAEKSITLKSMIKLDFFI